MTKTFNPFKLSRLGLLNFWLVQFFFVRIYCFSNQFKSGYGVLGIVLPFTGWWNDYSPEPQFKKAIPQLTTVKKQEVQEPELPQ